MGNKRILEMLTEIVDALDYDLCKSIFDDECAEDPEVAKQTREDLIKIVKKYIK